MTTVTLPTGNWLFVKVPKNSLYFELFDNNKGVHWVMQYGYSRPIWFDFEVEIFSLASAMTEALAALMVDKNQYGHNGWKVYTEKSGLCFWSTSALESFDTLMTAHGMYTKNPLGERPERISYNKRGTSVEYNRDIQEWQSYESKVSEYIILKEVK